MSWTQEDDDELIGILGDEAPTPLPTSQKLDIFANTVPPQSTSSNSTKNAPSNLKQMDSQVKFSSLCAVFERVLTEKSNTKRIGVLESLWMRLKSSDLYPFMRLILPDQDSERNKYGLKDKKLAELYIDLIPIPKTSDDAKKLRHWKDPSNGTAATTFADALYNLLKRKGWGSSQQVTKFTQKELSVKDVNELLDDLCKAEETEDKKKIFMTFLHRLPSAVEHKWLSKIILKDMRMHVKYESVLNAFHERALEMYNRCSDLREVIHACQTANYRLADNMGLRVFSAFKPMLASLAYFEKLHSLVKNEEIVSETKFDGERVMIHKKGNSVKYFTRNSQDYTRIYSAKYDRFVMKNIKANSCILDGEMLVYSQDLGGFKEFGHNRTFGLSDESNTREQFCYVAFDIVVLENKDISTLPLSERRKYLERTISVEEHCLEIVQQKRLTTAEQVMAELQTAIQNRDEGIILKNLDSMYIPGERKQNWIKLKPDHVDGMGETLDLLIVGGYYGTKFGRKSVSHFLLAIAEPVTAPKQHITSSFDSGSQNSQTVYPSKFYTFCKVGSGYNNSELTMLQSQLMPHFISYDKCKCPTWLKNFKPKSGETPDVWIDDPKNSKIIEVKAYEFVKDSEMYSVSYTLRFPRVKRIREDKSWHECLDYKGLMGMVNASEQKQNNLANLAPISSKAAKKKQRKGETAGATDNIDGGRKRKAITTLEQFTGVDVSTVTVKSKLLVDMEFVIFNCQHPYNKMSLERMIISNGGTCVQNPTEKTTHLLACKAQNVKVQNWIKMCGSNKSPYGDKDIIQCKWITKCCEEQKIVSIDPSMMIYTSKKTEEWFKTQMDEFFDDYTTDATVESLKKSLQLAQTKVKLADRISTDVIEDFNSKYGITLANSLTYLRPVCAIACPFTEEDSVFMDPIIMQLQIHGGRVINRSSTRKPYHSDLTHIVLRSFPTTSEEINSLKQLAIQCSPFITSAEIYIVTISWIVDCLKQGDIVQMRQGVNYWADSPKFIAPYIQKPQKPPTPVPMKTAKPVPKQPVAPPPAEKKNQPIRGEQKPSKQQTKPISPKTPPRRVHKRKKYTLTPDEISPVQQQKRKKVQGKPHEKETTPARNTKRYSPKPKASTPPTKIKEEQQQPETPVISRKNMAAKRRRRPSLQVSTNLTEVVDLVTPPPSKPKARVTTILTPSPNSPLDFLLTPSPRPNKPRITKALHSN